MSKQSNEKKLKFKEKFAEKSPPSPPPIDYYQNSSSDISNFAPSKFVSQNREYILDNYQKYAIPAYLRMVKSSKQIYVPKVDEEVELYLIGDHESCMGKIMKINDESKTAVVQFTVHGKIFEKEMQLSELSFEYC
jgi:transcription antitermination factor NusG